MCSRITRQSYYSAPTSINVSDVIVVNYPLTHAHTAKLQIIMFCTHGVHLFIINQLLLGITYAIDPLFRQCRRELL